MDGPRGAGYLSSSVKESNMIGCMFLLVFFFFFGGEVRGASTRARKIKYYNKKITSLFIKIFLKCVCLILAWQDFEL